MSRLSDEAYHSRTAIMISGFNDEQKANKLLELYVKNRKLEATNRQLQARIIDVSKELEESNEKIQQLGNEKSFGHLKPYMIKYSQFPESEEKSYFDYHDYRDPSEAQEATELVYYHRFNQEQSHLEIVDRDFASQILHDVIRVLIL
jgi:hypothetical protein